MSIHFNPEKKIFTLKTDHTVYQMKVSPYGHLLHLYYAETIKDEDLSSLLPAVLRSHESNPAECGMTDRIYTLSALPQEFSTADAGDYRSPSIELVNGDGSFAFVGKYVSHTITEGKYKIDGMPSLFANPDDHAQTLEILLKDEVTGLSVKLLYGVFPEKDVITRCACLENTTNAPIHLRRMMSMSLDFLTDDYDLIGFHGHHYYERLTERNPLHAGIQSFGSSRGSSGHYHNPFGILCSHDATETNGEAFGFCFLYSGNFLLETEVDGYHQTRVSLGIHPSQFDYFLSSGEAFQTPEVVLSYSPNGFSTLSHQYHRIFRENICRSKFMKEYRPIPLNSWEPFRFTFDKEKLVETAKLAKKMGADLFVLDDGWFGKRNNDKAGLGDWICNEEKLPGGIPALAEEVHKLGMKFGLWFEPEMVNPDSDLYRAHPDWVLQAPNRAPSLSRYQLCLDLSRKDVCDYLIRSVNAILDTGCVDYVKWDYNRLVCDAYSATIPPEHQGEVFHRYELGLYRLLDAIVLTHPDILFEGCAGGGGRFDGAMMAYFPQTWCSDNTDAPSRLTIHYGTSFAYPVSTMGSHVSVCPNKKTGRTVPLFTRAVTAMHGSFGYELDPAKLSEEERADCAVYSDFYRQHQALIYDGDYYRLSSPYDDDIFTAWQFVSKDKKHSLVFCVTQDISIFDKNYYVHCQGLADDRIYTITEPLSKVFAKYPEGLRSGKSLEKSGVLIPHTLPPYTAFVLELNAKDE